MDGQTNAATDNGL